MYFKSFTSGSLCQVSRASTWDKALNYTLKTFVLFLHSSSSSTASSSTTTPSTLTAKCSYHVLNMSEEQSKYLCGHSFIDTKKTRKVVHLLQTSMIGLWTECSIIRRVTYSFSSSHVSLHQKYPQGYSMPGNGTHILSKINLIDSLAPRTRPFAAILSLIQALYGFQKQHPPLFAFIINTLAVAVHLFTR